MAFIKFDTETLIEEEQTERHIIGGVFVAPKAMAFDPADDNSLILANNTIAAMKDRFIGILMEDSTTGQEGTVQISGKFSHGSFSWATPRATLYFDGFGNITDVPPTSGDHIQEIGYVLSEDTIFIEPEYAMSL